MDALINVNGNSVQSLEILFLTTAIMLLPSLLVMMSSFTRYVISFSFLRTALGTQQSPPNIVLIGLSLFLTFFTMAPALDEIKETAYEPYVAQEISQEQFVERAQIPLKDFMLRNTKPGTLRMFCDLGKISLPEDDEALETVAQKLPLRVIVPSFMTCELQAAFMIGLLLYLPFLLIDVVVSSTLMAMGMVMLPPAMISMPFKLLLFVSVNGWELLFSSLIQGFK